MDKALTYGQALAQLRMKARLSQDKAAEQAGISQPTWARYERGDSGVFLNRISTRTRLVRALGFSLRDLEAEVSALESDMVYVAPDVEAIEGVAAEAFDLSRFAGPDMRRFRIHGDEGLPYVRAGGFVICSLSDVPKAGERVVVRRHDGGWQIGVYQRQTASGLDLTRLEAVDGGFNSVTEHVPSAELAGVYPVRLCGDVA
ncbi:MAG: helix-turn-helix domain-containing protein [Asticcacaulis sp.]